ncbi:MAG: hypothetical protein ACLPN6_06065, partial [Streptosporangiaceae bacterium]
LLKQRSDMELALYLWTVERMIWFWHSPVAATMNTTGTGTGWAIAEGRSAAAAVDQYLSGETVLPAAISPLTAPLR